MRAAGGPIAWMARNRVAANLLMVGILAAGLFSLGSLDQEVLPEHSLDRIQVSVPYPGASPAEVDESIVRRIEERIRSIEGIRSVQSVASEGLGSVVAELARAADADRALEEIKAAVDGIPTFPAGAERPAVTEMTSRRSVMRIALYGDVQERTLKELAHRVEDELSSLAAVSHVRTSSVRDYEISIEVPTSRLNALGLTLADVAAAVRSGTLELSAGSIDTPGEQVRIRTAGRSYNQHDFENIIVLATGDGTTVRLGDIAEVRDGFADGGLVSRYNGQPAAFIEVYRTADERVLDIAEAVERQLRESVAPGLPPGVGVDIWSNDADPLAARLGLMLKNGFLGLLLVLGVLTLFLDLRLAFWVAAGIAVSFVGTLAVMAVLDVSINLTSLFAFILAVGIVVDDAVVVGENIAAERERGHGGPAAAIRGARRVRAPVTFGVLTTMAAFLPLFFVPSSVGAMAEAIPVIVISVLAFSLLESLLVLPHHLSRLPAGGSSAPRGPATARLHTRAQASVNRALERFVNGPLDRLLRVATARPGTVVAAGAGTLIVVLALVPAGIVGVAFTPTVEGNLVTATLEMPEGTPRARTANVAQQLEDAGRRAVDRLSTGQPEGAEALVTGVAVTLGGAPETLGAAIVASGGAPESVPRAHIATVQFRLLDAQLRTITASALEQAWREEAAQVTRHRSLSFSANLVDLGLPVHVELAHPDPRRLTAAADTVATILRGLPGVFDVRSDQDQGVREIQLDLKPEARTLGLGLDDLARQVRAAFFGEEVVRLQRGREEVRVYARLAEHERDAIADLETYRVRTPAGGAVHLGQVAAARFGNSPIVIRRQDGSRVATVTADAQGPATPAAIQRLDTVLEEMSARDPGLEHSFAGERQEVAESMGALGIGFALSLFAIYALLAIPFRSYVRPLIVMAAIPFGLVGAVLGHLLLGFEIAATSIFGFVGLSGVVVNDSIVMLDFISERQRAGMPVRDAIIGGAKARFRPIFLTSLTTFLGVAPLILEQDLQARFLIPMAASLGFGIIAATGVLMVIVPALATLQMGREGH
ncbi:MAG: efflux RND transporter permease subunit [Gemmatimonadetes bacterium]|nr:efflux RND transporter permease subunit [Gemmatimonadota bacterium]MXX70875.1 efflux RND transporter permease subunit [Gemmatimonadota bacterium]MYC92806.1 efflux RND transporter permease subunit [Gemmatimonadota bacterium]MYG35843.1 efflux RND transporter permease subunit [Gemmatimonadota bacterium]